MQWPDIIWEDIIMGASRPSAPGNLSFALIVHKKSFWIRALAKIDT